jgi:hypothetical protein
MQRVLLLLVPSAAAAAAAGRDLSWKLSLRYITSARANVFTCTAKAKN